MEIFCRHYGRFWYYIGDIGTVGIEQSSIAWMVLATVVFGQRLQGIMWCGVGGVWRSIANVLGSEGYGNRRGDIRGGVSA